MTPEMKTGPGPDATRAWQAIVRRDHAMDGRFVYGVATTGVYCRPSCPARRPRAGNVRFFATADAAERAGFRACLRCDPRGISPTASAARVERARRYLEAHLDDRVTLDALAHAVGGSPFHLQRMFKRFTGVTPKEYVGARRVARLKSGLRKGATVTTAIYDAGYGSGSRAYEHADARLGMTPTVYRDGGRDVTIRFAVVASPIGRLLVGATERGICSVRIGNDDRSLEAGLRREYPNARIERARTGLEAWIRRIVAALNDGGASIDVPLDLRATAFQCRVWRALREIPSGRTQSYRQVAAAIGHPTAVRAVARACATNPVALVVPCHRVVRADGDLGGYRWGVDRKRQLLDRERRSVERTTQRHA